MYLSYTTIAAACVIVFVKVHGENDDSKENLEEDSEKMPEDMKNSNHTFVALIDIVFLDNTKRTCTGAIIHDNVVITAAHCFFGKDKFSSSKTELTASFVVIGTKKMFDTGYEQYLPIERIVVHPKYSGWTANLALVYTFAGMTSDKPGTVIPLAGENSTAHLDANVTVFSWGQARNHATSSMEIQASQNKFESYKNKNEKVSDESCSSDGEKKTASSLEKKHSTLRNKRTAALVGKYFRNQQLAFKLSVAPTNPPTIRLKKEKSENYKQDKSVSHDARSQYKNSDEENLDYENRSSIISRYLTIRDTTEKIVEGIGVYVYEYYYIDAKYKSSQKQTESGIDPYVFGINNPYESSETQLKAHRLKINRKKRTKVSKTTKAKVISWKDDLKAIKTEKKRPHISISFKSNKDWRRSMGPQQNCLLIENFSFVNIRTCRDLAEKVLPYKYNISKHNDAVCYTNFDRSVDENDSGAPAVRQGQLVAITVGGVEADGDHAAVGMKMSCYCSWISDNLPPGSPALPCCKNCCDVKHKEEKKKSRRFRLKNKFVI